VTYTPVNLLLWLDLPVLDIDRAVAFYAALLDCPPKHKNTNAGNASFQLSPQGSGLTLIRAEAIEPSQVTPYLNCHRRLDQALAQVRLHQGKILQERHSMEPFGERAVILDSEGNRLALHSA
jgi:predicted enzyme related to lactoylglutathione lyase